MSQIFGQQNTTPVPAVPAGQATQVAPDAETGMNQASGVPVFSFLGSERRTWTAIAAGFLLYLTGAGVAIHQLDKTGAAPDGRSDLISPEHSFIRIPHPDALQLVRSEQFRTQFADAQLKLFNSIPAYSRYAEAINERSLALFITDTSLPCTYFLPLTGPQPLSGRPPPDGLYKDDGRILLSEARVAIAIEDFYLGKLTETSDLEIPENLPLGDIRALAFLTLQTCMHEIWHELHDKKLEAAAKIPHYFVTLEEELTVEIQSLLDFESGRFHILFNASQFDSAIVLAAQNMQRDPNFWNLNEFEKNFKSLYPYTDSIYKPRLDLLENWTLIAKCAIPGSAFEQEVRNILPILAAPKKFEQYRSHIQSNLEEARQRWTKLAPYFARTEFQREERRERLLGVTDK